MTKRIVALVLVLVIGATAALIAGCGGSLPSGAMAKVGSVKISASDLTKETDILLAFKYQGASTPAVGSADYKEMQQEALDFLVTYEICKAKSTTLSISVSDAEIQSQIDSDVSNAGSQSAFDTQLKGIGLTLDQYKVYLRQYMLETKAYQQVTLNVKATDKEISDYYNKHKSDYVTAETRTIRHILIDPTADRTTSTSSTTSTTAAAGSSTTSTTAAPATQAELNAALAKAQKVRADLVAGASWTTEAKLYSNDPGTKDKGGALGTVSKGNSDYVAEFNNAAFSLKLNEISQPVKTVYGYHIIQVTAITPAKQQTLAEVKDTISSTVLDNDTTTVWNKWVADQKKALNVVIKEGYALVTTTTGDTTTTTAGSSTTAADSSSTTAAATTSTASATTTTTK